MSVKLLHFCMMIYEWTTTQRLYSIHGWISNQRIIVIMMMMTNEESSGAHQDLVWPPLQGGSCTLQSSCPQPPCRGGCAPLYTISRPCWHQPSCSEVGVLSPRLRLGRRGTGASSGEEIERGVCLTCVKCSLGSEHVELMFSLFISYDLLSSLS